MQQSFENDDTAANADESAREPQREPDPADVAPWDAPGEAIDAEVELSPDDGPAYAPETLVPSEAADAPEALVPPEAAVQPDALVPVDVAVNQEAVLPPEVAVESDTELVEPAAESPFAAIPYVAPVRPPVRPRLAAMPESHGARVVLLSVAYCAGLLLYLTINPTLDWLILATTGCVAVGVHGILGTRSRDVGGPAAQTIQLLFLPSLLALGAGLFLKDVSHGYWDVPAALAASVLLGVVVHNQRITLDGDPISYPRARSVLDLGTYLAGFAFYSVIYSFDVSVLAAALCVGLVSLLLAVEILSEAEADPLRALVFAGVAGLIVAEARLAFYFVPLDGYLAGIGLLLVFYLTSGIIQHHLSDALQRPVIVEFVGVTLIGMLVVVVGRVFQGSL